MARMDATAAPLWPLVLYASLVISIIAGLLMMSHFLGQRHDEPATGDPYESGIVHVGSGRARFPVRFYLVAVLFVIFDLEAVFIFAWAVAAREAGWAGYIEILIFIAILGAALFYLWRVGALDWWKTRRREEV
jgi:NADH-quinone oxidoreductase subunit A